ncbi:DoxX family membrane protein [candidate division KSB1 bacterium]|nr:DoxX family membrane protein [candidate division KSB1 bacterium]
MKDFKLSIYNIIRFFLGILFLATGLAKIPDFSSFSYAISKLVPVSQELIVTLAINIIIIEILCGIGLLSGLYKKQISQIVFLLLGLYICFLTAAIFQHIDVECKCFAFIGISLSAPHQVIVDFILLNLSLFLVLKSPKQKKPVDFSKSFLRKKMIYSSILVSFLWASLVLVQPPLLFGSKSQTPINLSVIQSYSNSKMTNGSKSKIILLVNRADFNCHFCFQDFLAFCDALKEMEFPQEAVSIIVKKQPRESEKRQLQMLKLWHNQLGIIYPMILDRVELYEQSGVEKTTLVLLDNENRLILYETIPMKASRRLEILSRLKS